MMVDFTFCALQPKLIERDRFYKVYVTREALLGAWIAGHLWSWSAAVKQVLIFAPLAYWPLRMRHNREAVYDRLISDPSEFLARDRRNFSLPYRLIRDARPTKRFSTWTGIYRGSTLTLELTDQRLLDLIVIKPHTSHDVADRLGPLGYVEGGFAPRAPALADDGNPYRAPLSV